MKILIVEDNVSSRILLNRILKKEGYQSVNASNGAEAIRYLKNESFDAVLTDWMMPQLDGIELIRFIRKSITPSPVILMITALNSKQARDRAIEAGADDYIAKPFHIDDIQNRLQSAIQRRNSEISNLSIAGNKTRNSKPACVGVGIAASTGGPSTLIEVFESLNDLPGAAVFLVLHGPSWMLKSFAERIQGLTGMKVRLASEAMPIAAGEIYIAPGDRHMIIDPQKFMLHLSDSPPENFVRPSADPLFKSLAGTFGPFSLAVVLTGMGHDGTIGSGYIAAAGGVVIAQEPSTAIAPSMPQSIIDLRIAGIVSPLAAIPSIIETNIRKLSTALNQ
ncbi:MAG: chemotaxis protein CheB [Methanococcaceae archaeon]